MRFGLEHFGRRSLLLQQFRKLPRALLFSLEEPHVLDRDGCLVGESLDQCDLLVKGFPERTGVVWRSGGIGLVSARGSRAPKGGAYG